jgi:hypothetical protein
MQSSALTLSFHEHLESHRKELHLFEHLGSLDEDLLIILSRLNEKVDSISQKLDACPCDRYLFDCRLEELPEVPDYLENFCKDILCSFEYILDFRNRYLIDLLAFLLQFAVRDWRLKIVTCLLFKFDL